MVDLLPGDIDILFCITFCILSPLSIKKYVLQQWGLNLLKYRLPQLKSTSDLPIFHFYHKGANLRHHRDWKFWFKEVTGQTKTPSSLFGKK